MLFITSQLVGKAHQLGCPKIVLDHVGILYIVSRSQTCPVNKGDSMLTVFYRTTEVSRQQVPDKYSQGLKELGVYKKPLACNTSDTPLFTGRVWLVRLLL